MLHDAFFWMWFGPCTHELMQLWLPAQDLHVISQHSSRQHSLDLVTRDMERKDMKVGRGHVGGLQGRVAGGWIRLKYIIYMNKIIKE